MFIAERNRDSRGSFWRETCEFALQNLNANTKNNSYIFYSKGVDCPGAKAIKTFFIHHCQKQSKLECFHLEFFSAYSFICE
jgi:hypothetical protein